ncbi:MAG: phosphoglycerate kinase [Prevotellaceae bacterium]|jgi:phosphoglycerate kinase|nr:phosphoglycerate kinase [Prevotellaceae bacterium]
MQLIDSYNFEGKRAIVRFDFNVPLNDKFEVTDDTRIRAAIPTINKIFAGGGSIIAMSHLGRPKGATDKYSLKHIIPTLEKLIDKKIVFAPDCMGDEAAELAASLKPGEFLLLENLRFYAEEEGKPRLPDNASDEEKSKAKKELKEKQKDFYKKLASYADCYVNDAFGTAHRAHASTALIAACFPNDKMFGYIMSNEIKAVETVLNAPARPFTAILGGSKVSSKIGIIEKLIDKVDNLIVGGGMSFTFIKALGGKIGNSICEDVELAQKLMDKAKEKNVKILIPSDVLTSTLPLDEILKGGNAKPEIRNACNIPDGEQGFDAGPASVKEWKDVIMNSKTILWNGPVGVFESETFAEGTLEIGKIVAEATSAGAYSLVGGGDSVAAINKFNLAEQVSYVSTGGGALLEYVEGLDLPGVKAIKEQDFNT